MIYYKKRFGGCLMNVNTGKTAILERSIFLERFLTYRVVFEEYFKTMSLIDRGEVLKYETYERLTDNFLINLKKYIKLGTSYIDKYQLQNTTMEHSLNQYYVDLINSLNCMNLTNNVLDHYEMKAAKERISQSEIQVVKNFGAGLS